MFVSEIKVLCYHLEVLAVVASGNLGKALIAHDHIILVSTDVTDSEVIDRGLLFQVNYEINLIVFLILNR